MTTPTVPPLLHHPALLAHLRDESARFRAAAAAAEPGARVPTCPDWRATDLLWHLGAHVQAFWAHVVTTRPAPPETWEEQPLPDGPDAHQVALRRFDEAHAELVAALEAADPEEAAWTWSTEQTVGFTVRRQAHEALVHRVDAELAAGLPVSPVDPALAADGVLEALDVMFGNQPPWGSFTADGRHVRVDLDDAPGAGASTWVALGRFAGTHPENGKVYADEPDLSVVADPGVPPDLVVAGPGAEVDLWLWGRGDDARLRFDGDADTRRTFTAITGQPID